MLHLPQLQLQLLGRPQQPQQPQQVQQVQQPQQLAALLLPRQQLHLFTHIMSQQDVIIQCYNNILEQLVRILNMLQLDMKGFVGKFKSYKEHLDLLLMIIILIAQLVMQIYLLQQPLQLQLQLPQLQQHYLHSKD